MTVPVTTQADTCDQIKKDCGAALHAADILIKDQDDLIVKFKAHEVEQTKTIANLFQETAQAQSDLKVAHSHTLVWTIVGFVAGAAVMGLVWHEWDHPWK